MRRCYLGTSWHEDNKKMTFLEAKTSRFAGKGLGYLLIIPGVIHQRQPFILWPTLSLWWSLWNKRPPIHIFQSENVRATLVLQEKIYLQIVVAFCTQMGKVVALLLLAAVRFVPNWFVHCGRTKNRLENCNRAGEKVDEEEEVWLEYSIERWVERGRLRYLMQEKLAAAVASYSSALQSRLQLQAFCYRPDNGGGGGSSSSTTTTSHTLVFVLFSQNTLPSWD